MNKLITNILIIFLSFSSLILFSADLEKSQMDLLDTLPPDQRSSIEQKMKQSNKLTNELEEIFDGKSSLIEKPEKIEDEEMNKCIECIYGYDFFKFSSSTFAPTNNMPVTSDYILGPGDKLKVVLFGNENKEIETFISREGEIILPLLGPVNLIGISFNQALKILKNKVNKELIGTDISVSLVELRSMNIYLLGEAYNPGLYTISGLSSVINALFVAGGVNENGSLRNIKIRRGNRVISTYDFYEFLLKGSLESDTKLMDGDVIFIPFIENKIKMGGSFKRPHIYEIVPGETIEDMIEIAGGFKSEVKPNSSLELSTIDNSFTRVIQEVAFNQVDKLVKDGDMLNVSSKSGIESQSVKLSGQIRNPGVYSINPGDNLFDIIRKAGGYTDQAYSEGAIFLRNSVAEKQKEAFLRSADDLENTIVDVITYGSVEDLNEFSLAPISTLIARLRNEKPLGRMIVNADYLTLKTDPKFNIRLQDGDSLHIPERPDSVSVVGEVLNSSTHRFDSDYTIQDYIDMSGGLNKTADNDRIFIISPNGRSFIYKKNLFSNLSVLPGSTIVISRESRPLDAIGLTQIITPVLADLATSAAAIAAISD